MVLSLATTATAGVLTTAVGATSATQSVTVTITTAGTLNSISVVTQGSTGLDFNAAPGGSCVVGTSYAANATCTVSYTFSPKAPGSRLGAVLLYDNSSTPVRMSTAYITGVGQGAQGLFSPGTSAVVASGFSSPRGVSVDSLGNIYLCDQSNNNVNKITVGTGVVTVLVNSGCSGTTVDGAGNVFFGSGNGISEIVGGVAGSTPVQVASGWSPDNVLLSDGAGNLYSPDSNSGSIYEIASGTFTVTELYTTTGYRFIGMTIDSSGNLYAADFNGNSGIYELAVGSSALTLVVPGSVGGFANPHGLEIDPAGNFYTTNYQGNGDVQKYTAAAGGGFTNIDLPTGNACCGIAFDPAGNVLVLNGNQVTRYTRATSPALNFGNVPTPPSATADMIEGFENDGNANMTIAAIATSSASFTLNTTDTTCPVGTLVIGATCNLAASFTPATVGYYNGTINVTDNSLSLTTANIQQIPLTGNAGLTKTITFTSPVSPTSVATVATLVATASNGDPVTLKVDSGPATIVGTTITYTGTGTVVIEADSAQTVNYLAATPVTQTVLVGAAVGSPASTPLFATVTITTAGTLNANSISVVTQGLSGLDFQLASGGTCITKAYTVGQTCTVAYTFTAKQIGQRLGAVLVYSNASTPVLMGETFLSATGIGPIGAFTSGISPAFMTPITNASVEGMVFDAAGNCYVSVSNQVLRFNLCTGTATSLSGPGGGSFNGPQQLAIDGAGTLYVDDSSRIVEISNPATGTGTAIAIGTGQNISSHGIVVDAAGNAYFDDYNNGDRVAEIATGTQTITTLVTGLVQGFQMAIDGSGDLFVADNNGGVLYEIFAGTATLTRVTTNGLTYSNVYGVALDAAGHIYVNANVNTVVLPPGGGNAIGNLQTPANQYTYLTVGPNDNIYYFLNDTIYVISRAQGSTLGFGQTAVGSTSAPEFDSFENDGNSALTISGSSATTNFVAATSPTTPCTGTLVAGAVCSFGAEFAPTVAFTGEEDGTATLTDNSQGIAGSTQTIALVGTSPLTFAATNVGSSTTSTLTLTFTSATTLNSDPAIAIQVLTQGAPNLDFTLASGGTCAAGASYPAGGSCTVNVKFSPLFPGRRRGGVNLYDNSSTPVMVQSFYVDGVGNAPQGVIYPGKSTVAFNGFTTAFELSTDAAGNIYVSDYQADQIYQYTPISGGYTQKHITYAIGQTAIDGLGNLYVADPYNYRIVKETPSGGGNYNETIVLSSGNGTYYQWAVAVDHTGNLFVTDNNGYIYKETLEGSTYNQTAVSTVHHSLITQLAIDASGNLFAADAGDGTVYEEVYNSATGTYTETVVATNLSNTNGIAIDAAGELYIADSGQGQILKLIPQAGGGYAQTVLLSGISLNGVALDQAGNIYYSDGANNVFKIDVADPQTLTFPTTAIGVTTPAETVTVDNIGNLPLTISADPVTGSTYTINGVSTTCSTTPLIATGTCNIGLTFTPTIPGTATGTLTVTDNTLAVAGTNQLVNLTGYSPVTPTQVVVTTNSPTIVTNSVVATASIENAAGAIDTASGDTLSFVLTGPASFTTVTATSNATNGVANYNFGPLPVGTYSLTVSDTTTALSSGTATIIIVPINYTSAAPTTAIASTSTTQTATVTIDTTGTTSTTLGTAIQVLTQGVAALDFAYVTGGTCAVDTAYSAGQTCTVEYSFTPQYAGQRIGAIVLSSGSTALGTTYLSGTGTGPEVLFQNGIVSYLGSNLSSSLTDSAALDGAGNLYTFDSNNNIVKITPAGVQTIITSGVPVGYNGQVEGIGSLAVDGAGNIFFTENLYSYSSYSYVAPLLEILAGTTTPIVLTNLNSGSYGGYDAGGYNLTIDGAGNFYASALYSGQITEITAGTYVQTVLVNPLTQVGGLTVDAAGNIWFTETYNQVVEEIVAGSGTATQIISGGSVYYPAGIAIDPAGDLYVASVYGSSIYRFAAGTYATEIVAPSATAQDITWLQLDGAGNLYFGNEQSNNQNIGVAGKLQRTSTVALAYTGNNQIGSTSGAQTVTLENDGTSAATISSFATTYATLATGKGACRTATVFAAGSTCSLGIRFTPTALGSPLTGSVVVTDNSFNATTSTQTVNISGNSILTPSQIVLSTIATPINVGSNLGTITASIENSYGYTATLSSASVTFKLTGPTGFTTLTYTDTASSGVATQTFASTSLTIAGTYTLTATSSNLSTATITIVVNPGTPTTLTQTGGPTGQINAGSTIGPIQGTLTDVYGNVETNSTATISYTLTGPTGFTALTGSSTASSGAATFFSPSSPALNTPGNYTLTLTSGSLSSTPDTFLVGQITPVVAASVTSPITYGTSLSSLTATATYNGTTVPGSFTYTATPTGGTAVAVTTSTVLGAGTYIITATFNPTSTLTYKSPSTTASLLVNKAGTTTSVKVSATTINPNQTVTLTATVLSTTIGTPTLTVTFFDNGNALPAATLNGGIATLTTALSPGIAHVITATYNGDPNFLTSSTSTSATIVVNPLDFTFADTGSSGYTVVPGKIATYDFLVSPLYGSYPAAVSFSVTGLPVGATATFTPTTVATSGGAQAVVMSIQTPAPIGRNNAPDPFGTQKLPLLALLLLLPIGCSRKLRKKLGSRMLMFVLLFASVAGAAVLTGCGGNGNGFLLQQPATYTLTVTATSGTLQHTQTVTLTVQ